MRVLYFTKTTIQELHNYPLFESQSLLTSSLTGVFHYCEAFSQSRTSPFNIQTAMCSNVHHWVELRVEGDSIGLSALFCQESYTIYPINHSQSQAPKVLSGRIFLQLSSVCSVACTFLDLLSCIYWTTLSLRKQCCSQCTIYDTVTILAMVFEESSCNKKSDNPLHVQVFYSQSKIQFPRSISICQFILTTAQAKLSKENCRKSNVSELQGWSVISRDF